MSFIKVYNDFLDPHVFEMCSTYSNIIYNVHDDPEIKTNKLFWEKFIVKDSANIFIKSLSPDVALYGHIKASIIKKTYYDHINGINFCWFMPGSHIPWHNDSNHKGSITIYLNENWDKDTGGYFMFEHKDTNEIHAIVPNRNIAVEMSGNISHTVSPTTKMSEIRKTIQVFF